MDSMCLGKLVDVGQNVIPIEHNERSELSFTCVEI